MLKVKNLLFSNKKTVKHLVSNISAKLLPPYSRLLLLGDSANWVLSWEMRELARISMHLGIKVISETWYPVITNQSAFFSNHFSFFNSEPWRHTHNRLAVAYLAGENQNLIGLMKNYVKFTTPSIVYKLLTEKWRYSSLIQVSIPKKCTEYR